MVLLSEQAVIIKDQKSQKLIKKWYYLDIAQCLNHNSERRSAILPYGAVYQGLSALLRLSGAIDWITGEEINDVLYFEEKIDSHHIFPIAWCKKQGIDPKKYNCLVNRTPLSAKTNKRIGSKAPSVYLKELERSGISPQRLDEILLSHAISPETLRRDDFEGFFQARSKALLDLIGQAMSKS